jgi:hypothetical protein
MNKKIVMITLVIGLIIIGTGYTGIGSAVTDQDPYRYAPILYFVNEEKCYPVNVSYAFENSYLYEVGNPTPISTSPNATLLSSYSNSDNFYLDNQRGTVAVGDNGIENDYQSKMDKFGYNVYAHVDSINNAIQYWFFYAFNGGDVNRHEGDWEMIQVVLSGEQPVEVMFSQHDAGQTASWSQVEKDGEHVKVYVAKGSHANYIKPYSGKVGLASDTVADNGKILHVLTDYRIEILDNEPWLNFAGHWGWYGATESEATEAAILGEAGPNGPMFREDRTMWQPLVWAGGLQPANNYLFILEWIVYNFLWLFIIFTLVSLLLLAFFIYHRHKKHGLGPRRFSLFYIDGMNAKSIGNILCIIGIIIAILGLLYPWYTVTANVSIPQYKETGSFNALSVDGLNGIQVRLPDRSGPVPLGTFALPFYVLIGIGLVFLVLATIGISTSKKLGKKYLTRGLRLVVYFILILVLVMAIGYIVKMAAPAKIQGKPDIFNSVNAISAAPFGGRYSAPITDVSGGSVFLQWGFGIGAYLLLFAGIILLIAGLLEILAHDQFYEEKSSAPIVTAKNIEEKKE